MANRKIRISVTLYEKLEKVARAAGYSTTDEFIVHVLDKTASVSDSSAGDEEVRNRLKGLGYLG